MLLWINIVFKVMENDLEYRGYGNFLGIESGFEIFIFIQFFRIDVVVMILFEKVLDFVNCEEIFSVDNFFVESLFNCFGQNSVKYFFKWKMDFRNEDIFLDMFVNLFKGFYFFL